MRRFWSNLSIVKKIFTVTTLSITLFLILCIVAQAVFYEKIYTYNKQRFLNRTADSFIAEYQTLSGDEEIQNSITQYAMDADSFIMILNQNGNIKYMVTYEMKLRLDDGSVIRLSLDNLIRNQDFLNLDIQPGDTVTVDYMYFQEGKGNIFIPRRIACENGEWMDDMRRRQADGQTPEQNSQNEERLPGREKGPGSGREPWGGVLKVQQNVYGKVVSVSLPAPENGGTVQRVDAMSAVMDWMDQLGSGRSIAELETVSYQYMNLENNNRYEVVVKKLNDGDMVFALTALGPVEEALRVIRVIIMPWLAAAFVLALIVAVIFSRLFTRPVVRITQITTKMRDLDFSEKCRFHYNDEVGQLAQNINDMSDTLDRTIQQLVSANEKLKADIEKERALEQQRKEFVASVSHELKTPLAIVRAYAEALIDCVSENKRGRYLDTIVNETKKMDRLVLDMLENSRLEAGVEELVIKEYDLVKLSAQTFRLFEKNMQQKNIHADFHTQINAAYVLCDCDKIEQVINNFMSNALRHTPEGGRIIVEILRQGEQILFSVENQGSHIREDELDKIWDRFYKADKARERSAGGTGLGLSIAKNILILHHAPYGVENTELGVRFWFSLQLAINE